MKVLNLIIKQKIMARKTGWDLVRQATKLANRRYGRNADNPSNLVNRILGRYAGNIEKAGKSWNDKIPRSTYMGMSAG